MLRRTFLKLLGTIGVISAGRIEPAPSPSLIPAPGPIVDPQSDVGIFTAFIDAGEEEEEVVICEAGGKPLMHLYIYPHNIYSTPYLVAKGPLSLRSRHGARLLATKM